MIKVKFNCSERNILGATGMDRTVVLYDIRAETPLAKVYLNIKLC